ncbi:MAG TPA: PQQ-binding-like beta-propeller repeat protein [Gemmataceae bacterium]|nr:PQQ-binding-like beta-propeller repeat protein [Gemmataceae bacterium]
MPIHLRRLSLAAVVLAMVLTAAGLLGPQGPAADAPALPGLVAVLRGHTEPIYGIAFTPDGKHVITGSFDRTLRLWETATGKEVKTFAGPAGHQNQVLCLALSPDGTNLASGSSDNTAKLWDIPSTTALRRFVHADAVTAIALSPDGTRLAGAGKDGTVKVWAAADGKELLNLRGHSGAVTGVAFSANGQLLVSSGADQTLRFWNPADGKPLGVVGAHAAPVNAVLIHPNNNAVYSAAEDGTLNFWTLPLAPQRSLPSHADAVTRVVLSADGSQVFTASADKTIRICTFANGQQVRQLTVPPPSEGEQEKGEGAAVTSLAVAPGGAVIAAGTADQRLVLWNTADGKVLHQAVVHAGPVTGVAFHPQSKQLLTAGGDGLLKLWALPPVPGRALGHPDGVVPLINAHVGGVADIAFHGNGTQALSGGADKMVKLWDLAAGKEVRSFGPLDAPVTAVGFSRDFTLVVAAAGKVVKVWNAADGKELLTLTHPADVTAVSYTADKARLATGAADGLTRVWDVATGRLLESFRQGGAVRAVAFHPNNTTVISGCAPSPLPLSPKGEKSEGIVAVNVLSAARVIPASSAAVRGLALTPNGSHILTAGADKTVKLWNIASGANERTFGGAAEPLNAVAVSRNGALVAAGGAERRVRIHNFADGKELTVLQAPGVVRRLAFSPNNQTLAAACEDGSLPTWNVVYNAGQPLPADFGKPLQTYAHESPPPPSPPAGERAAITDVVFAADSLTFYSGGMDRTARAWKFASDTPTRNFAHPNLVDAVAFNPAGTQLATGCHDGAVRLWDIAKNQQLRQINAHTTPAAAVYAVAWSADGKQVLSASYDHSLKLWDAGSGNLVREFKAYKPKEFEKGHRDSVYCAAFSPDGKLIASGSARPGVIKLWNVADGTVVRDLENPNLKADPFTMTAPAHPGDVFGLRFTADGKYLISVGAAPRRQGYLAVWDVSDGKLLWGGEWPVGIIHCVAVSPDGKLLALGTGVGTTGRPPPGANQGYILTMPEIVK